MTAFSSRLAIVAAALGVALSLAQADAARAAGICRFPPVKPVVLKDMGPCQFDRETLSFAGNPAQQAACLLRPVFKFGKIGEPVADLPRALADFAGRSVDLPGRALLGEILRERGLDAQFRQTLDRPVSRTGNDNPAGRSAVYFVIHDTSSPNFRGRSWPSNIDSDKGINNLSRYSCANKIERAHIFINRSGAVLIGHDFEEPWRATKFEMAVNFEGALKGLFVHVELVQPRAREPRRGRNNDFRAPMPGFSKAQYDTLALAYTVASVRAGYWMIPAFHAVIDEGIRDKHDDPQNFDLSAFVLSLEELRTRLRPSAKAN